MAAALKHLAVVLAMTCLAVVPVFSQAEQQPADGPKFGMGLGIAVQTFNGDVEPGTWQSLSLTPDFSIGKFGVGLDVGINLNLSGSGGSMRIRRADWAPEGAVTLSKIAAIYLPKIAYIRWGQKGDDLFLKLGSFSDGTLGSGFIMGNYNNKLFLPTERHFGLQADVDGKLFNFPYIGFESVIGNLAHFDVIGGRVFGRPLIDTSIPILNNLEVGATAAGDTDPYLNTASTGSASTVGVFGIDVIVPLVYQKDVFSMIGSVDGASLQGRTWGSSAGVGGRIINIFTYTAALRLLGMGFTPTYFGPVYDTQRDAQYIAMKNAGGSGLTFGGLLSLGTSLLGDKLIFKLTFDTPFVTDETDHTLSRPHLNGALSLAPGTLPVVSVDFMYDKKAIGTFAQLVDPTNAAIQGRVNMQSGPAVISFIYIITYDPRESGDPWTVTSGLQTSIALF